MAADIELEKLIDGFWTGNLWQFVGLTAFFGAAAAVVQLVASAKTEEEQKHWDKLKPKTKLWEGCKAALVGATAAIAILYVATPKSTVTWLAGSLVAGYGGKAILASLVSRATATARQGFRTDMAKVFGAHQTLTLDSDHKQAILDAMKDKYSLSDDEIKRAVK